MRLLTKQWYQTMQDSGLGVLLAPDERAAVYSQELFALLWEEKMTEWLRDRRELCPYLDQIYNEAGERARFAENYRMMLEQFRERTPADILERVADLRLLALGYCAEEVFQALEEYRENCRKRTEQTLEEVWKQYKAAGLDKVWLGEQSLHDSVILSMKGDGEDLLIEFERDEEEWPEIKAVRFRDARILKQEAPAENAWWLYDEIWRTEEGGYEIHALLWRDGDVFELTVSCREAELQWTIEPRHPI